VSQQLDAKPIGPSDALENATKAARAGHWEESVAWSSLGMLALKMREMRKGGHRE
jgi:hypothetical protein